MIERHGVESRGREMGLRPRRDAVTLQAHGRKWRNLEACLIEVGDVVLEQGIVRKVERVEVKGADRYRVEVYAGDKVEPVIYKPTAVVRVFSRL